MKQLRLLATVALVGCADLLGLSRSDPGAMVAASRVQLYNDGTVRLEQLSVTTGRNVPPVTKAALAPGELSARAVVAVVHETPLVSATVEGRKLTMQPIEGFGGFNAQLPSGSYVIRLRYVPEHEIIVSTVEEAP